MKNFLIIASTLILSTSIFAFGCYCLANIHYGNAFMFFFKIVWILIFTVACPTLIIYACLDFFGKV